MRKKKIEKSQRKKPVMKDAIVKITSNSYFYLMSKLN